MYKHDLSYFTVLFIFYKTNHILGNFSEQHSERVFPNPLSQWKPYGSENNCCKQNICLM